MRCRECMRRIIILLCVTATKPDKIASLDICFRRELSGWSLALILGCACSLASCRCGVCRVSDGNHPLYIPSKRFNEKKKTLDRIHKCTDFGDWYGVTVTRKQHLRHLPLPHRPRRHLDLNKHQQPSRQILALTRQRHERVLIAILFPKICGAMHIRRYLNETRTLLQTMNGTLAHEVRRVKAPPTHRPSPTQRVSDLQ